MNNNKNLLTINNLHTYFHTEKGTIKAVNDVSIKVDRGRTLGVVGESGSGKSITSLSILRLLDKTGRIENGEIIFDGVDLNTLSEKELRKVRGNDISMIFQEPMTSLNPVFKVGKQIGEVLRLHQGKTKAEARQISIDMLDQVGIPRPDQIVDAYPFQLSGGMRQRVMIAMALACKPKLLIADEPTTALDVTIQAQILKLMNDLKRETETAILFITHDLGVINEMADDVAVMYAGQVVDSAPVRTIFGEGEFSHPYTEGLLKSIPRLDEKKEILDVIPGSVPHPLRLPVGCKFAPRCPYATEKCMKEQPDLFKVSETQSVRCFYPKKGVRSRGE